MGAETQNQRLAGSAAARMRAAQAPAPETGKASMFPNEAPGPAINPPTGAEEMAYQRQEITRERDRTGRREEIFRDMQRGAAERGVTAETTPGGAVERGAGVFGASFGGAGSGQPPRSGIQFGPGRTTRMPEVNSPEYQALLQKVREMGQRRA